MSKKQVDKSLKKYIEEVNISNTPAIVTCSLGGTIAMPGWENTKFNWGLSFPCNPNMKDVEKTAKIIEEWVRNRVGETIGVYK